MALILKFTLVVLLSNYDSNMVLALLHCINQTTENYNKDDNITTFIQCIELFN